MNRSRRSGIRCLVSESLQNAVRERTLPRVEPDTQKIIHSPEPGGYQYSHHPHIICFSGFLLVMWSSGIEKEDRPGQRILWSRSKDGKRWSESAVLLEPPAGCWRLTAGGWATDGSSVYAFANRSRRAEDERTHVGTKWYPPLHLDVMVADENLVWSDPRVVDSDFLTNEAPRKTSGGTWLCAGTSARGTAAFLRSDTGPAGPCVFVPVPTICVPRQPDAASGWTAPVRPLGEPSWYERIDGTIVCFLRDDHASGYLFVTESLDSGLTWSRPEITNIPDAKAKTAVVKLQDGRVLLFSNPLMAYRRKIMTVLVSDDGHEFNRGAIIHEQPAVGPDAARGNAGWQYPSGAESDGRIWLTVSDGKRDIIVASFLLDSLP
ncbi:MAG TPA: exo-alpha-sialidase [Candidatus Latescibacteria bacterium]|nr:exo-alpha-sialidase [Candidatus Latescibacterota bacterium]